MRADGLCDRLTAIHDFFSDVRAGPEDQQRVSERVVPDHMALLRDFAHDVRSLPHIASNQKERRANVVPGQNIEQMQRVWIVGAVIEGQRDLL